MLVLTSTSSMVIQSYIAHLPEDLTAMRLTYVPTACEVEKGDMSWLHTDRQALVDAGFKITDFTFTGKSSAEVVTMLENTDVLFVSGGNTFYLLQEMRKSGFTDLIEKYIESGLHYIGSSAGSVVAGPDISLVSELDDPSLAPELVGYSGLGLTDVVVFPHWGNEHFHDRYQKLIKAAYRNGLKIVLLTDEQYLLVDNGRYTIESI